MLHRFVTCRHGLRYISVGILCLYLIVSGDALIFDCLSVIGHLVVVMFSMLFIIYFMCGLSLLDYFYKCIVCVYTFLY